MGITVGTTAVAIFAVAIQLQHMYMTFATAISAVFLPRITGMVVTNNNTKEISDIFIKTGRIQYVIMSLVLSGFIVFGKKFIKVGCFDDLLSEVVCVFSFQWISPIAIRKLQRTF